MAEPEQTEAEILEESLETLERHVRQGLGVEAPLVNVLKNGLAVEAMARSDAGRALIRDCLARAAEHLQELTRDPASLTPEKAFHGVLALSLEVGILRRIAATISAGNQAGQRMIQREQESEALRGEQID
ncbi:MAG: hypothetical protein ACRDK7_07650 [Solirubrobacteraceae bacterium]